MSSTCDRVRQWAALAPDNVLSELEQRMLDAHLHRCPPCRSFATAVAGITSELRSAELERPWPQEYSFRVSGRCSTVSLLSRGTAVAAVLVALITPALVGRLERQHRIPTVVAEPIILDGTALENDQQAFLQKLREYRHQGRVVASDLHAPGHPGLIAN